MSHVLHFYITFCVDNIQPLGLYTRFGEYCIRPTPTQTRLWTPVQIISKMGIKYQPHSRVVGGQEANSHLSPLGQMSKSSPFGNKGFWLL